MPNKAQIYAQMADDAARKITGDYLDWAAFLNTSSKLYKYPFHDQLMIYAQRPDATACATYELWNDTMRRYIRRGSKGIALLTPGPYGMEVRYVFDVSDTGMRRNSRNVEPWAMSDETMEPVRQMLEDQYYAEAAMGIEKQIDQIAQQQALEYWRNHARDIRDSVDGSQLAVRPGRGGGGLGAGAFPAVRLHRRHDGGAFGADGQRDSRVDAGGESAPDPGGRGGL